MTSMKSTLLCCVAVAAQCIWLMAVDDFADLPGYEEAVGRHPAPPGYDQVPILEDPPGYDQAVAMLECVDERRLKFLKKEDKLKNNISAVIGRRNCFNGKCKMKKVDTKKKKMVCICEEGYTPPSCFDSGTPGNSGGPCENHKCPTNSECVSSSTAKGEYICICNVGYSTNVSQLTDPSDIKCTACQYPHWGLDCKNVVRGCEKKIWTNENGCRKCYKGWEKTPSCLKLDCDKDPCPKDAVCYNQGSGRCDCNWGRFGERCENHYTNEEMIKKYKNQQCADATVNQFYKRRFFHGNEDINMFQEEEVLRRVNRFKMSCEFFGGLCIAHSGVVKCACPSAKQKGQYCDIGCTKEKCNPSRGSCQRNKCVCHPGYGSIHYDIRYNANGICGTGCSELEIRRWGIDCLEPCGNCLRRMCNPVNGTCDEGCPEGWKPPYCDSRIGVERTIVSAYAYASTNYRYRRDIVDRDIIRRRRFTRDERKEVDLVLKRYETAMNSRMPGFYFLITMDDKITIPRKRQVKVGRQKVKLEIKGTSTDDVEDAELLRQDVLTGLKETAVNASDTNFKVLPNSIRVTSVRSVQLGSSNSLAMAVVLSYILPAVILCCLVGAIIAVVLLKRRGSMSHKHTRGKDGKSRQKSMNAVDHRSRSHRTQVSRSQRSGIQKSNHHSHHSSRHPQIKPGNTPHNPRANSHTSRV